jgi:hypothetical protein
MTTLRMVVWAIRIALALACWTFAIVLTVKALHIPLEAGGVLFTPMLLGAAFMSFSIGLAFVVPYGLRGRTASGALGASTVLFPWL